MSDPHRGAYTPNSDAPLSFDARQPVRGGGQAPVTLLISAGILVVLVVAIFFVYRGGVRKEGDAPRPVGTPVVTVKDQVAGDAKPDPASGLQIYKTETDPGAAEPPPKFAPGPEAPQARPAVPVTSAPISPPPTAQPAAVTVAKVQPAPVTSIKPPAAPAAVAVPTPRPAAPQTIAAAGGSLVQIGAFSSQAQADSGWTAAARIAPGLAVGKGKSVQAIDSNGKTLYRTAVTGFETRASADAFCSALKAAGKTCFVR